MARRGERLDEIEEYRQICRVRLEHVVEVSQPLLYSAPKKIVTGFMPRTSMHLPSVERFFGAYPATVARIDELAGDLYERVCRDTL
jgi:hypothetical protein